MSGEFGAILKWSRVNELREREDELSLEVGELGFQANLATSAFVEVASTKK